MGSLAFFILLAAATKDGDPNRPGVGSEEETVDLQASKERGETKAFHRKFEHVRRDSSIPGASTYVYHAAVILSTNSIYMGLRVYRWFTAVCVREIRTTSLCIFGDLYEYMTTGQCDHSFFRSVYVVRYFGKPNVAAPLPSSMYVDMVGLTTASSVHEQYVCTWQHARKTPSYVRAYMEISRQDIPKARAAIFVVMWAPPDF